MCRVTFATTDAVLEHLNDAHPTTVLASFVTSIRGRPLLEHRNYLYSNNHSLKTNNRHSWKCERRQCKGKAITCGQTVDDVTSIVVRATEHNHPASSAKVRLASALHRMRVQALETDDTPLAIRQQLFATVDPEVAKLLPSEPSMRRVIQRQRQRATAAAGVRVKDISTPGVNAKVKDAHVTAAAVKVDDLNASTISVNVKDSDVSPTSSDKGDDIDASAVSVKVKHADVTTTAVMVDDMAADCHSSVI